MWDHIWLCEDVHHQFLIISSNFFENTYTRKGCVTPSFLSFLCSLWYFNIYSLVNHKICNVVSMSIYILMKSLKYHDAYQIETIDLHTIIHKNPLYSFRFSIYEFDWDSHGHSRSWTTYLLKIEICTFSFSHLNFTDRTAHVHIAPGPHPLPAKLLKNARPTKMPWWKLLRAPTPVSSPHPAPFISQLLSSLPVLVAF